MLNRLPHRYDKAAADLQLIFQRLRNMPRRRSYDDAIEGRMFRPSLVAVADADMNIFVSKTGQAFSCRYAKLFDELMNLTKNELGVPIVLLTPFYISTDRTKGHSYRSKLLELLPRYIDTVEEMSVKYGTKLLRTQEVFQEQLKHRDANVFIHGAIAADAIHPNHAGYLLIADALFRLLDE